MEVYPLCSSPSWDTLWNCFCLRERLKPHVFAVHGTGRKFLVSSYFENFCGFCSNFSQLFDDLGHEKHMKASIQGGHPDHSYHLST